MRGRHMEHKNTCSGAEERRDRMEAMRAADMEEAAREETGAT